MSEPTLCMIHEAISTDNAIGKVALTGVRIALEAGWRVTVVAKLLDESLRDRVEWLKLYVPRRGFALQWLTARHFIRKAVGGRTFDVVHAHQPQVADLADVFQCHFLTRVAYERKCLERRPGLRPRLVRAQQQAVLYAEDFFYKRWNPRTRMLFCSQLLREEFVRLYGAPPCEDVVPYACPPPRFATPEERSAARARLLGADRPGPVVGYLGGVQERKGYNRLIDGLIDSPDVFLLLGGQYTRGLDVPALAGRHKSVGLVSDTDMFYAACDAVAVPSFFDPCPMVVFEAVARGVPVIATDGVGNLHHLVEHGAGVRWDGQSPLGPVVRDLVRRREAYLEGARRLTSALSRPQYARRVLGTYDRVLRGRTAEPTVACAKVPS